MQGKTKRTWKLKLAIVFITYLVVECICFAFIRSGYIPAREPSYHFIRKNPPYPFVAADIDSNWGIWHYPEPYRSQQGCLYFDYVINSYGARDKERVKLSQDKDRIVVLGDSFMEGYGIAEKNRLSNLLENATGTEFMNFACADMGTTQELLVYENLAMQFDHSTVLIGMLPFNDLDNDDPAKKLPYKRYKPFFLSDSIGFQLTYIEDSLQESEFNRAIYKESASGIPSTVSRFLRAWTWWYNVVDYARGKKYREADVNESGGKIFSRYYDYTSEHAERLRYVLTRLRASAVEKKIILFTIPVLPDLLRFKEEKNPPLPKLLKEICDPLQINYVDLLPLQGGKENFRDFYLSCDPHWNEAGHLAASKWLLPLFKNEK